MQLWPGPTRAAEPKRMMSRQDVPMHLQTRTSCRFANSQGRIPHRGNMVVGVVDFLNATGYHQEKLLGDGNDHADTFHVTCSREPNHSYED